ncbi:hypothetical protein F4803DRAFT_547030 [Xylaria telfairii]|nr:hypothetical protein F4803DRAFT_547030 [Xylaria telfairii]
MKFPPDRRFSSTDAEIRWARDCTWITWYKADHKGVRSLVWDLPVNNSHLFAPLSYPSYKIGGRPIFLDDNGQFDDIVRKNGTSKVPSYQLLDFHTWSLYYKLSVTDPIVGSATRSGSDGTICGWLTLDGFEQMDLFRKTEIVEVILLSRLTNYLKDRYYAMCLEWKDGIAERRGMGEVLALKNPRSYPPGPRWKHIVLG